MPYRSNLPAVEALVRQAIDQALDYAGRVLKAAVVAGYDPPTYFIGEAERRARYPHSIHPTGNLLASITISAPFDAPTGRAIRVGTNVVYALYWELGWVAHGTGSFHRKPVWVPAMVQSAADVRAGFDAVFYATLRGAAAARSTGPATHAQDVAAD